jgi:hypothetical protein
LQVRGAAPVGAPLTGRTDALLDGQLAAEHTTTIHDLPSGWTLVHDAALTGQDLRPPRTCLPERPIGRRSAGHDRQFSHDLAPDGAESGHLTVTVLVQATKEDAALTLALVQDPAYQQCQAERGIDDLGRASGSVPALQGSAALPLPPGLTGRATRATVAYSFRGRAMVSFQDSYDVLVGRALVRMGFQTCCTPFGEDGEADVLSLAAARFKTSLLGT